MANLPNAKNAFVDIRKIREYLFDPTHHRGKHKARVFRAALGIGGDDAEWFRDRLLHAATNEEAQFTFRDEFGERYNVEFTLVGLDRNVRIRSSWMVRHGETFPRFVSCTIL